MGATDKVKVSRWQKPGIDLAVCFQYAMPLVLVLVVSVLQNIAHTNVCQHTCRESSNHHKASQRDKFLYEKQGFKYLFGNSDLVFLKSVCRACQIVSWRMEEKERNCPFAVTAVIDTFVTFFATQLIVISLSQNKTTATRLLKELSLQPLPFLP
jgi:hypothetical protein